ncbi:hypothetical protein P152DRAFT_453761, partial [Eremomyces bilateralis CBS 781.70]
MGGRDFRRFQGKVAKALAEKNTETARLKAELQRAENTISDLGGLASKKRKRVQPNLNERFVQI